MVIFTIEEGRALQGPEPLQDINVVTNSAELSRVTTNNGDPKLTSIPPDSIQINTLLLLVLLPHILTSHINDNLAKYFA